jgi:hypothetical protein
VKARHREAGIEVGGQLIVFDGCVEIALVLARESGQVVRSSVQFIER